MQSPFNALRLVAPFAFSLFSAVAAAQTAQPGFEEPAPAASPMQEPAPVVEPLAMTPQPPPPPADGPRFRFGIDFAGGFERVGDVDFGAWLVGFDLRMGVQINDLVGIFVEPHLSFGNATSGGSGSTGTFAGTVNADFTIADRIFFGAGFGYGVLNNPAGPVISLRVGAYPVVTRSDIGPRRKGLSTAIDVRAYFLGDGYGSAVQFMAMVGYEAF